jgi:hypothetical protein
MHLIVAKSEEKKEIFCKKKTSSFKKIYLNYYFVKKRNEKYVMPSLASSV